MKHTPSRASVVVVACLGLVLAGTFAMTPAGANLQQGVQASAEHNWNKIWKQKIRPKSDRRYYTKAKAKDRFAEEDDVWTKVESDLKYATKADTWTRAEADAKYATKPQVVRGTYTGNASGAGSILLADVSFGVTLAAAPTPHYIPDGTAPPAGCSGTPEAPDAAVGHLCFFESVESNVLVRQVTRVDPPAVGTASRMGAWVVTSVAAAGSAFIAGSWVVRFAPGTAAGAQAPQGGPNPFG